MARVRMLALAVVVLSGAACQRAEKQRPFLIAEHESGAPAVGVAVWCRHELAGDEPTHRRELRRDLAVSDALGRLYFAGDPAHCALSAEGATLHPAVAAPSPSGRAVRVTPTFACTSALLVVATNDGYALSWHPADTARSMSRSVGRAELGAAALEAWRANGEYREPNSVGRDCAVLVAPPPHGEALAALRRPSRPGWEGVERPAFDVHVWSAEALCRWAPGAPGCGAGVTR